MRKFSLDKPIRDNNQHRQSPFISRGRCANRNAVVANTDVCCIWLDSMYIVLNLELAECMRHYTLVFFNTKNILSITNAMHL